MTFTKQQFIDAGVPCVSVFVDDFGNEQVDFGVSLTPEQWAIAEGIIYPEKKAKNQRKAAAITTINGLAGRNISSINNTADRDTLLGAICYLLGICDETGVILEQPIEAMTTKE